MQDAFDVTKRRKFNLWCFTAEGIMAWKEMKITSATFSRPILRSETNENKCQINWDEVWWYPRIVSEGCEDTTWKMQWTIKTRVRNRELVENVVSR
jgi:hypothetical protein